MQYRSINSRSQGFLFNNLEDWIDDTNPVRLLDVLIDELYKKDPSRFEVSSVKAKGRGGRPAYHPLLFCKLYLYGYLNRINSSRRLESECHRNMELMWLLSLEKPDFKTISNFRRERGDLIRYCCRSFRLFLKEAGYIKVDVVALDGCKIKANAAKEGYTLDGVIKRITSLEAQLEHYLESLDRVDKEEEKEESSSSLKDLSSIKKEIERLEKIKEEMEKNSTTSYFPGDPDSRLMKGRYGSYPAYNVQAAMDQENHMVVMAEATNHPNDWNELTDSVKHIEEELEVSPGTLLADKGYANKEEIKEVEENHGVRCVIPLAENEQIKKDLRYNLTFTYDPLKDVILCPMGKELPLRNAHHTNRHGTSQRLYRAKKVWCERCPKKDICKNTKHGRTYYLSEDKFIREYTERSHTKEFIKESKRRKGLIEHLFGTFRIWMGKNLFLLTSLEKVQTEIDLYATAYNFKRLINLVDVKTFLERVRQRASKVHHGTTIEALLLFKLLFLDRKSPYRLL